MPELDEYALDFLEPDEKRLVEEFLMGVVEYPHVHENGFSVSPLRGGGWQYFLAGGSGRSPVRNPQTLSENIVDQLVFHGIAGLKIKPQWPPDFSSFTEAALEWYRKYGGPNTDDVRKFIGRAIRRNSYGPSEEFEPASVSAEFKVAEERIREQTELLLATGLVEKLTSGDGDFGVLALSMPDGVLWAEQNFPPIRSLSSTNINLKVDVAVAVAVHNVIERSQTADLPEPVLREFQDLMKRVQEELEKPKGQGKFQSVKDLTEFSANFGQLLVLASQFIAGQSDRIRDLGDFAGGMIPK